MLKIPSPEEIQRFVKEDVFKWLVEKLAFEMNKIDTVRDAELDNLNTILARKMAIEIIENTLAELFSVGELQKLQKKLAEEEDGIIQRLKNLKEDY